MQMKKLLKDLLMKNKMKTSDMNGWYFIDPELAKMLLELNVANYRTIRSRRVDALAQDMLSHKWKKNGEPIVFGENEILQDGQHRLLGVIKSNTPIVAYLIFDAEITELYDHNLARSVKQIFDHEKIPVSNLSIAAGRLLLKYGTGKEDYGPQYVHDFVDERLNNLKLAENIVSTGYNNFTKGIGKKAATILVVYSLLHTGEISEEDMRDFFKVANSGNVVGTFKSASAALTYRNQILETTAGGRSTQKMQLEVTYKALKEYKASKVVARVYVCDTDDAERLVAQVYNNETTKNVA